MGTRSNLVDRLVPKAESSAVTRTREAFGLAVSAKVKKAVTHRQNTGVEAVWTYAEEAYIGIDDVNRADFSAGRWIKPLSMEGPVSTGGEERDPDDTRSRLYVRLTARYVDAGAAKLQEILIPIDDKAFSLKPTPVPDLIKGKDDLTPLMSQSVPGQPLERDASPEEIAQMTGLAVGQMPDPMPETWPPRVPLRTKDVVEEQLHLAEEKAKKAETRIYDWMVECKYPAHMRRVIFDAAKLGVGVLKGPFPDKVRSKSLTRLPGQPGPDGQPGRDRAVLQISETIKPSAKHISPWNLFPDPSCGEDIHDGDYICERDFLSPKQVRELKGRKGYATEIIDQILAEGPGKCRSGGQNPTEDESNKERYEVFYFYGTIDRDDLALTNPEALAGLTEDQSQVYAIVTLINDRAVFATVNPLDSGHFPYRTVPWIRRSGYWAGIGAGEQLLTPQRLLNGATRALADNAGLSAGVQLLLEQAGIFPADGEWTITPNKVWLQTGASKHDDARKCIVAVQIPNVTDALRKVIDYALQMAEESTNIPLITQGQSGKTTPDTFGAAQLQNNNANQLLRSIGTTFDDQVTEPIVDDLYEWLLLDPDVPDEEKGDFLINAHGSAALVERAIQDQTIQQMSELVSKASQLFGVDPKKWFREWLKSKRLDPRSFMFSEEEQDKIDKTPPPPAPVVQAAMIRAEAEAKQRDLDRQFQLQMAQVEAALEERRLQIDEAIARIDTDRDTAYVQAETARTRNEHAARMHELESKREIAILDYSNKRGMAVEKIKADLAKTVMTLKTQKDLAHAKTKAEQVATPVAEPPGRAQDGKAFTQ